MKLKNMLQEKCGGDLRNKTNEEIYFALLEVVQDMADAIAAIIAAIKATPAA